MAVVGTHWDAMDPMLFVGLTLGIVGAVLFNAGVIMRQSRTLDEEHDAGYQVGYRAGRRAILVKIEGVHNGGIPATTVRSLAGHRAAAGRSPQDAH